MLAVVFGLERFKYYAYGRHVTIETDHKPLEAIFKKHLDQAPPRISRMLLRIQEYDVTVKYVPGKDIQLADALSRVNPCAGDEIDGLEIAVHEIHATLNASPMRIKSIKDATANDQLLQQLARTIHQGWPDQRSDCPSQLLQFWNYRDELCVEDGMLIKGSRIIVPETLQAEALRQLHCAHQGSEKMKLRAKGVVFWAGINNDIDEMVKSCTICQANKSSNTKETLIPHDVPRRPWYKLGADLFHLDNDTYLLLADYGSKFPIVRKLPNTTSKSVINNLKVIFSEQGIPEILISDNGPQFAAAEFKDFAQEYGFQHITSSPLYPQSNGFIERNVQTIKNIIKKCHQSKTDIHMALLCLRATPISSDIPAPCVALNNRMFKTNLPMCSSITPHWKPDSLQQRQNNQKQYHDQGARDLQPLVPDQPVRIQDPVQKTWSPGTVIRSADTPRSYHVEKDGVIYRRNRRHLNPVPQPNPIACATPEDDDSYEKSTEDVPVEPTPIRRSSRIRKPHPRYDPAMFVK